MSWLISFIGCLSTGWFATLSFPRCPRVVSCPLLPEQNSDCAVCANGYAPGSNYRCHRCSESTRRAGAGAAVVMIVASVLLLIVAVWDVKRVAFDGPENEIYRSGWQRNMSSCIEVMRKAFPLVALKIVLVVWQIITQVRIIVINTRSFNSWLLC